VTDYRMPNEGHVLSSEFPSIRRLHIRRDSVAPSTDEHTKRGETESYVDILPVDAVVMNEEGDSDKMLPHLLKEVQVLFEKDDE